MFTGLEIAGIEVGIFIIMAFFIRKYIISLTRINKLVYYWMMFTILTGFWEFSFITHYKYVNNISRTLIASDEHVWSSKYNISYILPWKMAYIFYAEYGAYADREYMVIKDDWSRVIEGTHALFCALFCLFAFLFNIYGKKNRYTICLSVGMGGQFMNSILYLVNYFIQCNNPYNVNYGTPEFPTGKFLSKRLFMYVNVFWFLFPAYTILHLLLFKPHSYILDSKC